MNTRKTGFSKKLSLRCNTKAMLYKRINILNWLPLYSKFFAVSDIVAGITVGLTMMPQSMAYANLANLPAHYGLYSSFMGAFIYLFFGTIKEVSIGPTSLMALLTLSYTYGLPMDYIILLCFLCGWIELLMGIFKLGFLVDFISAPAISGFTSATSIIIIMAQLKGLVGIKFKSYNLLQYFEKFISHWPDVKAGDTILGISCIIALLIIRSFKDIKTKNMILKKTLWFLSIGRNALVVVIGSLIAYYFESKYGKAPFVLSGTVNAGIPNFRLPNFSTTIGNDTVSFLEMVHQLGSGIIVIPIVAVLANVAIAKAFSSGKTVDATQEMITLGLCNIFGACVQSMPTCGAFTRSAVANSSGIRTPFAGIYAGTIILLALTFLTPYFYYVPKATLSAVLISAVIFMIDYEIVPKLWKSNKFDLSVTLITFFGSLAYSVEHGLLAGVVFNLFPLLKAWTRPKIDYCVCSKRKHFEYILVKPELGLYFSAIDYLLQEINNISTEIKYIPIVIDCHNIIQIDYTATKLLNNMIGDMQKNNRQVIFLNLKTSVLEKLQVMMDKYDVPCCNNEDEIYDNIEELRSNKDEVEMVLIAPK